MALDTQTQHCKHTAEESVEPTHSQELRTELCFWRVLKTTKIVQTLELRPFSLHKLKQIHTRACVPSAAAIPAVAHHLQHWLVLLVHTIRSATRGITIFKCGSPQCRS